MKSFEYHCIQTILFLIPVEEKKGHIFWYKDYFADKQKLLEDLMEKKPDLHTKDAS